MKWFTNSESKILPYEYISRFFLTNIWLSLQNFQWLSETYRSWVQIWQVPMGYLWQNKKRKRKINFYVPLQQSKIPDPGSLLSTPRLSVYTKAYSNALGRMTWCKVIDNNLTSDIFRKIILKLLSSNSLNLPLILRRIFPSSRCFSLVQLSVC